ncbi:FliM/FliN family flagellar motor switch protein [Shimia sp.]|uniref:FliM/FliN family flagellar motor switch protein n=1 Tax=Shimia sp. TaxID=1954381 RepID=UPI00356948A4
MVEAEAQAGAEDSGAPDAAATAETPQAKREDGRNIEAIFGVKLDVRVVLGRNQMPVSDLLKLTKGSVIELDRKVGEQVDVMVNDKVIARGDLVKVQGDMIGVALREVVKDFVPDM